MRRSILRVWIPGPLGLVLAALLAGLGASDARAAWSPADSAAAARNAWREAREARSRGDHVGAMLRAERAHAAWPMQWYYAYGWASLAAEAGEPSTTARALDDLAAIGAGPDLSTDSTLMAMGRENITVQTSLQRVAANRAPLVRSKAFVTFAAADSAFYPEGLARDSRTGRLFVAGVRSHKVAVVAPGKPASTFASTQTWGALAVAVDGPRGRLWVTSGALPQVGEVAAADTGRAAIECFNLKTGASRARYELPRVAEGHVPGDVCVAPNGDVYVTDSAHPAIYRVRSAAPSGSAPEEWLADPALHSLQGQAFSADGRTLYVADYSHGIAAIDVAAKRVRWLEAPAGACVLGIDGMARAGNDLVAVQNGIAPARIVRLVLGGAPTRITALEVLDRNLTIADEPTMLVVDGARVIYVANSQWEKYDDAGVRKRGIVLTAPVLLSVPFPATR